MGAGVTMTTGQRQQVRQRTSGGAMATPKSLETIGFFVETGCCTWTSPSLCAHGWGWRGAATGDFVLDALTGIDDL
jgi:hypothetical protein